MPFFLRTFEIQEKDQYSADFLYKMSLLLMLKIFYFPLQESQNGVLLVKKSVSLGIQVARNCRLTEVGKRFMPRSYALALKQGEHDY